MPRVRLRAGVDARSVAESGGASVRSFVSCELEWRMGPMSKAWWRSRNYEDHEGTSDYPPRTLSGGMEDEE